MTTRFTKFGLLSAAIAVSFTAFACESGGVGDPCIPDDEYSTTAGGFSMDMVTIEARSFQCATRVCLVNKFQGRVSCPYGGSEEDAGNFLAYWKGGDIVKDKVVVETIAADQANANRALDYAHKTDENGVLPQICRTPGAAGDDVEDYVVEKVEPQFRDRPPSEAVYCSCRCANTAGATDDGANYCECPSGFACTKLDSLGLGDQFLAGSYCVRDGTNEAHRGADCVASSKNCTDGQYLAQ
jgi:hypothetical protein